VKFALEQARWPDVPLSHACEGQGVRAHHWQAPSKRYQCRQAVVIKPPSRRTILEQQSYLDPPCPCLFYLGRKAKTGISSRSSEASVRGTTEPMVAFRPRFMQAMRRT